MEFFHCISLEAFRAREIGGIEDVFKCCVTNAGAGEDLVCRLEVSPGIEVNHGLVFEQGQQMVIVVSIERSLIIRHVDGESSELTKNQNEQRWMQ